MATNTALKAVLPPVSVYGNYETAITCWRAFGAEHGTLSMLDCLRIWFSAAGGRLFTTAYSPLLVCGQCWRYPAAFDYRILGPVQAQKQVEVAFRGGEPIALFFAAGRVMLHVEIKRAIRIELQRIAIADSKA